MLWVNWSGVPAMDAMGSIKKWIKLQICWRVNVTSQSSVCVACTQGYVSNTRAGCSLLSSFMAGNHVLNNLDMEKCVESARLCLFRRASPSCHRCNLVIAMWSVIGDAVFLITSTLHLKRPRWPQNAIKCAKYDPVFAPDCCFPHAILLVNMPMWKHTG